MNAEPQQVWTIDELAAQVALALSVDYAGPGDGRTREVPDLRTIRYYTTLGLIDRPVSMKGRTALYGQRHLLQIVAIKRLQSKGQTLAELQQNLLGLTDSELAGIARLPRLTESKANQQAKSRTGRFWTERPAPVQIRPTPGKSQDPPIQGIYLTNGVTLLLTPGRELEQDDREAIRTAAGPLIKLLTTRRLVANDAEGDSV
jgi:DNA-binding transcriptional MerR regulator